MISTGGRSIIVWRLVCERSEGERVGVEERGSKPPWVMLASRGWIEVLCIFIAQAMVSGSSMSVPSRTGDRMYESKLTYLAATEEQLLLAKCCLSWGFLGRSAAQRREKTGGSWQ
jgi:hypothetical protein